MPLPKPNAEENKSDFISRCMSNSTMRSEFEDNAQRYAVCNSQWEQARSASTQSTDIEHNFSTHCLHTNNYPIRTERHQDRDHIVVPVVMMVEGVHNGSHGALYHPIEELGKYPATWNGIPVCIHHPEMDGQNVSANSPQIIDRQTVGRVYNTYMDDGKLKAECWIDKEKARKLSPEVLGYIMQQRPLDVSVGVFTDDEPMSGQWNNETYHAVARNHRPDHLALLPGGTGACSWKDGCGIRLNQDLAEGGERVGYGMANNAVKGTARTPNYDGTTTREWNAPDFAACVSGYWKHHPDAPRPDGGVNTVGEAPAAMKTWIASLSLLGNSEAETFDELLYFPVVEPDSMNLNEHALRAVIGGRGAQAGIPQAAKNSARRKAYNLLNKEFDADLEIPENLTAQKSFSTQQSKVMSRQGYLVVQAERKAYDDIIEEIRHRLDLMDDGTKVHFLHDVYDDYFIYEVRPAVDGELSDVHSSTLYRRSYTITDEGRIEFGTEPERVERKVEYVAMAARPLRRTKGGNEMATKEQVETLVQCPHTPFAEADREWLGKLDQPQMNHLITMADSLKQTAEKKEELSLDKEQAINALKEQGLTDEELKELMPAELKEQVEEGIKLHQEKRKGLMQTVASYSDVFTEEELNAKSIDELEKLAQLVPKQKTQGNYVAKGSDPVDNSADQGDILLPFNLETTKEAK